jgi:signal transduction histidine kinase
MVLLLLPLWLMWPLSVARAEAATGAIPQTLTRAFYQTGAFQILSIVAVVIIIIGLAILQYRRMAGTLRDRLEVRHAERERIARELHDTLLQGIQGLILHFQAVAERLPEDSPLRAQIDKALDRADAVLVEGRDRVRDLRASDRAAKDLGVAFAALGEGFAEEWPARFRVIYGGEQQEIDPVIREEIYLIGREALLNAFRHAQAAEIEAELAYDVRQFRLCVRDDGVGIPHDVMEANHRPGHWGLAGMRERASCIDGQLRIWARPGAGTEVELAVPASVAYAHVRRTGWALLKRLPSLGR